METRAGLPVVAFPSAGEWEAWLEVQGPGAPGLWLRFPKKGSGIAGLAHAEALDVALCFGWIDGQTAREDDRHWLQRFTPRGPRSTWSRLNRERALELIAEGRMRPGGLAAVEAARADGRWDRAYEPQSTAAVPDDLRRALAETPGAAEAFAGLDSRNRYAVLHRVAGARRAETRARRIEQYVAMLARGERLHP